VIAWAQKFKLEQVSGEAPRSPILSLLRSSKLLPFVSRSWIFPLREKLDLHFARMGQGILVIERKQENLTLACRTGRPASSLRNCLCSRKDVFYDLDPVRF
jgi:hypothetical protein